jgi:hypothetical protein
VTLRELTIDDVSGGLPRVTIDMSEVGGPGPVTYHLAPDAVRAIVDALIGVAEPAPGEARIVVKCAPADISRVTGWGILGGQADADEPPGGVYPVSTPERVRIAPVPSGVWVACVDEPADPRIYAETTDRAQVAALDGFVTTDVREVRWLRDAVEATEPPPSKDATTPGE